MSTLFDITPQEPARKKPRARKGDPPPGQKPEAEKTPYLYRETALPPLGKLDDEVACLDQNCQANCLDIVEEDRGQWLVECCFCGTGQWIPVIRGHLPAESDFRLRGGRFDGLTLSEVARSPRGLDYLKWAAAEHPRKAVKKACETWLAANPAVG